MDRRKGAGQLIQDRCFFLPGHPRNKKISTLPTYTTWVKKSSKNITNYNGCCKHKSVYYRIIVVGSDHFQHFRSNSN